MTSQPSQHTLQQAEQRISRALTAFISSQPFTGIAAMHLTPAIPDPGRTSIAADGVNLRYNPQWVAEAATEQIIHAIAHCVLACVLKHHTRRGDRTHNRWQRASRQVTQHILLTQGLANPEYGPGLDLSVIQAYNRLPPDPERETPAPRAQGGTDGGETGTGQQQQNQPGQEPQNGQQPQDGSSQQPSDPSAQRGEVLDHPARNPSEQHTEEARWDDITHQAITMAKGQGHTPGNLEELIARSHAPTLDWKAQLREFMNEFAPDERSWAFPDRRFASRGLFLPGPHSEHIPFICFAVDTSASLNRRDLTRVWNEIRDAADSLEPEAIRVLQCDARLQDDQTYDGTDLPRQLNARGRRGTNYRPVFSALEQEPPAFLIYLTDLDCNSYPDRIPDYPVLWVCTNPRTSRQPRFGERVDLPPEQNQAQRLQQ